MARNVVNTGRGWFLLAVLAVFAGCSEEPEPPLEVHQEATESHFPVILDGQILRHGGRSIEVTQSMISDVEVHELTENADGASTALVSFLATELEDATTTGEGVQTQCKVKVTYKTVTASISGGGELLIFPVESVETISLEPVTE